MSLFERLGGIQSSEIRRMFELAATRADSISLGIGEPDFTTPEYIMRAAEKALEEGATHYAPNRGIAPLREAIAEKYRRENGIECTESNVIVTVGATEGLLLALSSFLREGEEVLIPTPSFLVYGPTVRIAGGIPREVACMDCDNFHPLPDVLEASITEKTRAIILASPNNPTGAALSRKELERIAEIAVGRDLIVISDEVYERFLYDGGEFFSIGSIEEMKNRTITVNSFSKTYAMTGWRVGYIVADEPLIKNMVKLHMYLCSCVNTFAQYGALEALNGGYGEVNRMIAEYAGRREYVYSELSSMPRIRINKPEGAFYFFPSIKETGMSSREFCEKLFEATGVIVVSGGAFGECGEGYIRISYSTSMENLKEAMDRMRGFLEKIG